MAFGGGIADAMALGDCAGVIAGLDAAPPAESLEEHTARILARASCKLRAGDAAGAAALLEGKDDSLLAGYRRLLHARALAETDPARALDALKGLELPGAPGREVKLLRGRLGNDRLELESLLASPDGAEAAYRLGEMLGSPELLRKAWLDARPGGWDARAAEKLATAGHPVPDLGTPEGRALARQRLDALHERSRVAEALALANALAEVEPPADREAWILLGRVRFAARDYPGTLAAWEKAYGPPAEAKGAPQELFDYALCIARAGDYDTAGIVYRRVMAQHPGTPQADFASFKLGYMEWDRKDCPKAVAELAAHRRRVLTSKHLDEALWFEARCAWKAGDRATAAARWAELERARPKSSLVAGAAYWRARAAELGGDLDAGRVGFEDVLERFPTSAYAWLAAERVGRAFPPKPAAGVPPWPAALKSRPEVRRLEALLGVGLRGWALAELDAIGVPSDRAGALAVAWARLRAGDAKGAKGIACKHDDGDPVAAQACTPRPEPAVVERYLHELPAAVAYGVMVQESALDPAVTSVAGARGLMQLMPDLAEEQHRTLFPDRPYDPDDLFSAPYNVALGAEELDELAEKLTGLLEPSEIPAVVASYNGGEDAVRRWIGDTVGLASDEFVEDIGYVETRGYVKKVLGHAMAYRRVYGDPE